MKAQKWDFKLREYFPYELPARCYLHTDNMEQFVACAECGKPVRYGSCYTSKAIHTEIGLGYPVCESCYHKELELERSQNGV